MACVVVVVVGGVVVDVVVVVVVVVVGAVEVVVDEGVVEVGDGDVDVVVGVGVCWCRFDGGIQVRVLVWASAIPAAIPIVGTVSAAMTPRTRTCLRDETVLIG